MSAIIRKLNTKLNGMAASLSGIPLLLTRLYLAPVMAQAGWQKPANLRRRNRQGRGGGGWERADEQGRYHIFGE